MHKIQELVNENFFEGNGLMQPGVIEGEVFDENSSPQIKDESYCLILNNLTLHWQNKLDASFTNFSRMLRPNGVYIGSMLGSDTLQELRICLNLGEKEREGGLSPATSPMMPMTSIGNSFSRCNFSLPTIDRT